MKTLSDLISGHSGTSRAIGAPGREWMTYDGLRKLSRDVNSSLRKAGIGSSDRVAIVLPNGPEMAAAFVTIAQSATTAPLNPAYREEEFEFYLEDLKARALVVAAGYDGPARAVAERFDMIVFELTSLEPAGNFTLSANVTGEAKAAVPGTDDIALILHTSGTTSRPKYCAVTSIKCCRICSKHHEVFGAD